MPGTNQINISPNSGHTWMLWKGPLPYRFAALVKGKLVLFFMGWGVVVVIYRNKTTLCHSSHLFWLATICEINFSEPDGLTDRCNNLLLAQPLGKRQVTEWFWQWNETENKRWCHCLEEQCSSGPISSSFPGRWLWGRFCIFHLPKRFWTLQWAFSTCGLLPEISLAFLRSVWPYKSCKWIQQLVPMVI